MGTAIRCRYVDLPHGQVHLRSAGDDAAPALVLLHQTASSSAMFESLMRALADRYFMIAPDTPGFGLSDTLPGPGDIRARADALHQTLGALRIGSAFLYGHHSGATLAVQMQHDHALAPALALSGPPCLSVVARGQQLDRIAPFELRADGSHVERIFSRLRAKDPGADPLLLHRELVLTLAAGAEGPRMLEAVFRHDFNAQLAALACPLLLLAGEHDPLLHALPLAFATARNASAVAVPAASSYLNDRAPTRLAGLLDAFFATVAAPASRHSAGAC